MTRRMDFEGFTLIELIIVIAIIGILSAVAIPKFINLSSNAQTAATNAVAGALASASSTNYAARSLGGTPLLGSAVTNCTDAAALLQGGLPSSSYNITPAAVASGSSATCTLNGPNSTSATFMVNGIT